MSNSKNQNHRQCHILFKEVSGSFLEGGFNKQIIVQTALSPNKRIHKE